ncbi:MAG: glutamate--tRNA ligase [Spirochaetales bacterium]|nr:glutamate--tRNA ligase [Spirochaetales bacterium]
MSVRVRYAPSPTGLQHIGGVRTALFNYFFAKSQGGKFILRVEDTDRERYSDESLQDLYDTFNWLGIEWDEGPDKGGEYGPYVQSERFDLYKKYAQQLVDEGKAYKCYCTAERLENLRAEQQKDKKSQQGYDRHCRELTAEQQAEYEAQGIKPVIRFKVPLEGKTVFNDVILGDVKRKNKDISPDPVLLKSDGFPTYHLANIIDDHFMKISHIMRAQEWLPSGALHVLLYEAFGWEPPAYCHLPMVMGKDGQKLSKRHGSTSLRDFIAKGYLPEALINYVSLVGWSYDDSREFFEKEDLEKLFVLEKLNKAPGVFDYKKLDWFNGQYIRKLSDEDLKSKIVPYLQDAGRVNNPPTSEQENMLDGLIPIVKERLKLLSDIVPMTSFLFGDLAEYPVEDLVPKKKDTSAALDILKLGRSLIEKMTELDDEQLEEEFKALSESSSYKLGDLLSPLRVAVTGSRVSPPLFASIRLLGLDKALERIDSAMVILDK